MSIHIRFYTDEPVILTEEDFSGLEKEINDFHLLSDLSIPENVVFDYHHTWSEFRTYDFNDICAASTAYYHKGDDPFLDIDCLEVSIPDILLVGATGLIDPFWTLFIKRIKFKFEHFNQYVELPLIESGITLQQVISDPIAMSKKIGNRIIIATDRKSKAVIKTIYDDCKEFEEYLEREAKMLKDSSRSRKKKETTVQESVTTSTDRKKRYSDQRFTGSVDIPKCYGCELTARELNYWELVDSISTEERAYYGWEHDPQ